MHYHPGWHQWLFLDCKRRCLRAWDPRGNTQWTVATSEHVEMQSLAVDTVDGSIVIARDGIPSARFYRVHNGVAINVSESVDNEDSSFPPPAAMRTTAKLPEAAPVSSDALCREMLFDRLGRLYVCLGSSIHQYDRMKDSHDRVGTLRLTGTLRGVDEYTANDHSSSIVRILDKITTCMCFGPGQRDLFVLATYPNAAFHSVAIYQIPILDGKTRSCSVFSSATLAARLGAQTGALASRVS